MADISDFSARRAANPLSIFPIRIFASSPRHILPLCTSLARVFDVTEQTTTY